MTDGPLSAVEVPGWKAPVGYANGMLAAPGARTLYLAGQIGWDAAGRIVSEDFGAQFVQALDNVLAVLRAAGGGPTNLARLTVYVTDKAGYVAARKAIGTAWRERVGRHYPAMTLVVVAGLLESGAKVEIEGVAVL